MLYHHYLCCKTTGECIETVAHVGNKTNPRISANALGAFLTYHAIVAPGTSFDLLGLDEFAGERGTCSSLVELEDERESVGSFHGYVPPVMVWTEENYHEFVGRCPEIATMLNEFEHDAGTWVLMR